MKKLIVIIMAMSMLLATVACENVTIGSLDSNSTGENIGTNLEDESETGTSNSESNTSTSTTSSSSTFSNGSSSTSISSSSSSFSTSESVNRTSSSSSVTSSSTSSSSSSGQLTQLEIQANNILTWQIPNNGGWDKDFSTHKDRAKTSSDSYITKGWTVNGNALGTIDNDGTYSEMRVLAEAYTATGAKKYKDGWDKAVAFLENLQYDNGGFAQVYPRRGQYSDYITINDNAMVNVMRVLKEVADNKAPFKTIVTTSERSKMKAMFDKGIDCLLKMQLTVKGEKSGWCAQHDPQTLAPMKAREYELPSVSGSESIGVVQLLMEQTNNPEAVAAGKAAIKWFDKVKLENTGFDNKSTKKDTNGNIMYFYPQSGKNTWYRFYDYQTGEGFFSDRDGKKYYDISLISKERREGYSWAGSWPQTVIDKYGID